MTTRHAARLVNGTVALAFIVGLLFSWSKTSAGPRDRKPPTAPTNLSLTLRTDTTIAVAWNASTDDSGKFSYKARMNNLNNSAYNSLTTVSQSQTTFTARYLPPNNNYTVSVYAIDAAGNQSPDSNSVNTSTLADQTPPTAPALEAVVLAPSQVKLTWTKSTDNVANHCCSYGIMMNGSETTEHINWAAAPSGSLSVVMRHLTPATIYTFSISARDWSGGNVATSNTVTVTTDASGDTVPPTAPTNLHLVRDDSCGEVWLGWNEATDETDAQEKVEYEIYVNDLLSPLPVSAGVNIDFVYANVAGENLFYVKAVDRSGNTSAASNPIRLFLWPC
jgi:chitodextrinase